jgi:hypothetical protein
VKNLSKIFLNDEMISNHVRETFTRRSAVTELDGKKFICLNFTPRWHRWIICLFLFYRGYLPHGYVSFPGSLGNKMKQAIDLEEYIPNFQLKNTLLDLRADFLKKCPLILDIKDPFTSVTPLYDYPINLMSNSLFHIVTESEVSDNIYRVTEKIVKPIVGLQPFLVFGNKNSLKILKNMGFKTFDFIFNEEYDSVENPALRIELIFNEIDRLLSLPFDSLKELELMSRSVCEHNLNNLLHRFELNLVQGSKWSINNALDAC